MLKIQNDSLIGSKFSAAIRLVKLHLGKPKSVTRQQGRIIFNSLNYDTDVWLDEFLRSYDSYKASVSKLGEVITDEFLLERLRDPFIAFNVAVVPTDNYAQDLYNLAQSGAKLMEAKDEGTEVFDVPREHRQAWKTWSNMCVHADKLRAKHGTTVVRILADSAWDIRLLDNKLQPNAPQSFINRELNIAHSAQQLLLLPTSLRVTCCRHQSIAH